MPIGDSGGRALEADAIPLAVRLARQLDRTIQLMLSQSVSQNHDRPAPAALARMYALPGAGGTAAAWRMRLAGTDGLGLALRRLGGSGRGPGLQLLAGAEPPYAIANVRIDAVPAPMPFSAGYLRGDPHRALTFFSESFVDEIARLAGSDPFAFRMAMLGGNPRLARCLTAATPAAGWDGGGPGSTQGLAAASAFGSNIALVADASIGPDQRVKVHRLVAAVDCGRIANPQIVQQQIEGGLIWAIGTATAAEPQWAAGVPLARGFGSLGLPRIGDTPDIRVHLVPSSSDPGGVSGLAPTVLAPALANAIFAGTGRRLRSLPLDPMGDA
jgi:isoquinoline 1-oxidoreductase beta subunit